MSFTFRAALVGIAMSLSACVATSATKPQSTEAPPVMRWDFHPQAEIWTSATMTALDHQGAALASIIPSDIGTYCPAYAGNGTEERQAFWAGLFSALAKHESTWNPAAAGGGGRWIGLLQISPATARQYGCAAQSTAELKNGAANLSCGVRIAAQQVGRDAMVAGNGRQGVGRDWAPFRSAEKRADIATWTRAQSYCQ